MPIIKNKTNTLHHVHRPYTSISTATINTITNLSDLAVFVYVKSHGCNTTVQEISYQFGMSIESVISSIKNLKVMGVLEEEMEA